MIVLDTNIILEILEKRSRLQSVTTVLAKYPQDILAVTTLTLSNVFYLLERHKHEAMVAEQLLKTLKILSVTAEDADWAFTHYRGKDFEDALQVAAARREKSTVFLTLDTKLAKKYGKLLSIKLIK